jgi:hypothetical protein
MLDFGVSLPELPVQETAAVSLSLETAANRLVPRRAASRTMTRVVPSECGVGPLAMMSGALEEKNDVGGADL